MTENKKTQSNDEIDLIEVAKKTAQLAGKATNKLGELLLIFFKGVYTGIIFSIRFLFRNAIIIIAFAIAGYFAGNLYINISTPYYKTTATIQSNTIANASLIDYINRIHTLAASRDSISLSEQLNITVSEASNIKDLQAFWMIDKNKDGIADEVDYTNSFTPDTISNTVRITNKFVAQLLTYDPENILPTQYGLEAYINTYPRINQISEVKKVNLQSEIERLDDEIEILDSLKKYEYFVKEKELRKYKQNVVKLNELLLQTGSDVEEPTRLLHTDILELANINLENIRQLELESEPYIFLSKFVKVNNPVNIQTETGIRSKIMLLFVVMATFLALIFKYRKLIYAQLKEE